MSAHIGAIAKSYVAKQQLQQDIVDRSQRLLDDVMQIPGLTPVEGMDAALKMTKDPSQAQIFYRLGEELRKDYILNIVLRKS